MKQLILTEKPSVARDFAKALNITPHGNGHYEGKDHIITWAIGHLLQPLYPEEYNPDFKKWAPQTLPIILPRLQFKPNPKTKKQLSIITSLLNRDDVGQLLIATDAGREGELIARTILSHAKIKKESFRFWTSQALSPEVIKKTIRDKKPLANYDRLYHAGLARQYADWLVGINLTRMATVKFGDLYSIGRVQTAVLALIVNRHQEIEQFESNTYWHLQLKFKNFDALWFDPNKKENIHIIETNQKAQEISAQLAKDATVESINDKKRIEKPPHLFSLTELQQVANKLLGFSAKKTLELAQELYEKDKCLSYPRTDATVLGTESFDQISNLATKLKNSNPRYFEQYDHEKLNISNKEVFNDEKLTDHHALIPLRPYNGTGDKEKIYELVVKRFAMVFSKDFITEDSIVILKTGTHHFKAKGKIIRQMGWKTLDRIEQNITLPPLKKNEILPIEKINCQEKKSTPPPPYTESSLLRDMINPARHVENKKLKKIFRGEVGLGTQATRAQIIETLLERKYIIRDKKKMIATDKGIFLINSIKKLKPCGQLAKPQETAKWEESLELISQGSGDVKIFVENIRNFVIESVVEWKKTASLIPTGITKCPFCKEGQIVETKKTFCCHLWKEGCSFTVWKKTAGKNIQLQDIKDLIAQNETKIIRGFKSNKGNIFDAKLTIQKNRIVLNYVSKESS